MDIKIIERFWEKVDKSGECWMWTAKTSKRKQPHPLVGGVVDLSHDKGGSDRLQQWVRNDDLVVIVTASAKHAATGFIEGHRQKLPLLLVNSKGSASLVRSIQQYLTQEI